MHESHVTAVPIKYDGSPQSVMKLKVVVDCLDMLISGAAPVSLLLCKCSSLIFDSLVNSVGIVPLNEL